MVDTSVKTLQQTEYREPVAIIGLGAIFPGAPGTEAFWESIKNCREAIGDIPSDHWDPADYYDPDPKAPDKTYGRRGGFIDPVPFEPLKYGIAPNDLSAIDSTQLLGLVVADQALSDAGYSSANGYDHSRTAVILGVTGALKMVVTLGSRLAHPQLRRALLDSGVDQETAAEVLERFGAQFVPWKESSFPGLLGNVTAGRIANRLNLGGSNQVVDAACASSLAALRQGVMELRSGRADLVVSGGLDTFSDPFMYTCFSKTPALSPNGRVRSYDRCGDGTILGEGLGVLVLKRLSEARRDGDRIYALIRAVGASSDGRGAAIFAPSSEGQVRAIGAAYEEAGFGPDTVELIEGHGTGTAVGDAVEVEALDAVFERRRPGWKYEGPWCALGSVKSQIGHTKAAAGAAGIMKAALSLYHKVLPPTINVEEPLPILARPDSPLYVNTVARPWLGQAGHPRRAGISAFGFGGSNFHCLLEENEPLKPAPEAPGDLLTLMALSGRTLEELKSALTTLNRTPEIQETRRLTQAWRASFRHRDPLKLVMVLPADRISGQAGRLLARLARSEAASTTLEDLEGVFFSAGQPSKTALGFMYPGPEHLRAGLFRPLAVDYPELLAALTQAGRNLASVNPSLKAPLGLILYPPALAPEQSLQLWAEELAQPQVARQALWAVHQGLTDILARFGLRPLETQGCRPELLLSQTALKKMIFEPSDRIEHWLEVGPGQTWTGQAASLNVPAWPLDSLDDAGHWSLARALARLAAWGYEVNFQAWPETAPEPADQAKFAVSLSGANYFTKEERPPSPPRRTGSAGVDRLAALETLGLETARLHQQFLDTQAETLRLLRGGEGEPQITAPLRTLPSPLEAVTPAVSASSAAEELFGIVSAETGFPVEMLNLAMSLEADLGLDSIKKVEILAACSEKFPQISLGAEAFAGAETLGDLLRLLSARTENLQPSAQSSSSSASAEKTVVWEIVAQETGYPQEMLNPEMDLEADLGLDSIKKVEIMAALSERLGAEAGDLTEARTLGDLVEAIAAKPRAGEVVLPPVENRSDPGILDALMEAVSRETGFPRDMLTPSMNLEADLGLDSIKKVEVLAALAECRPQVVPLDQGDLSAAATIEQLAGLLSPMEIGASTKPEAAPVNFSRDASGRPREDAVQIILETVSSETGFPVEMLDMTNGLEADLGLDSIKKVEILALLNERLGQPDKSLDPAQVTTLADVGALFGVIASPAPESRDQPPARRRVGRPPKNDASRTPASQMPQTKRRPGRPPKSAPPPEYVQATSSIKRAAAPKTSLWRIEMDAVAWPAYTDEKPAFAPGSHVLLLADHSPLSAFLIDKLQAGGLSTERRTWREAAGRLSGRPPEALLIVWPGFSEDLNLPLRAFQIIHEAAPYLARAAESGRSPWFLALTFQGGDFGFNPAPGASVENVLSASLGGLAKTASHEWPDVHCRVLDLPTVAYDAAAASFADDVLRAGALAGPVEMGLSAPGCLRTPRLKPYLPQLQRKIKPDFGQTILVTGGARGVTAAAMLRLAQSCRPHLVILGRSPLVSQEPPWAVGLNDEVSLKNAFLAEAKEKISPRELTQASQRILAARELRGNLAALEKAGARVTYMVNEPNSLKMTIEKIKKKYGPIHGFIHGAGVLSDSLLSNKKEDDFTRVFETKAAMALEILDLLSLEPLKLAAFFSSSTARFGRRGQGDYAAGNEVLNKLAQKMRRLHPQLKALSVNWGPWAGGMVSSALSRVFEKENIGLIPIEEGAELFADLVNLPNTEPVELVVLGPGTDVSFFEDRGDGN